MAKEKNKEPQKEQKPEAPEQEAQAQQPQDLSLIHIWATPGTRRMMEPMMIMSMLCPTPANSNRPPHKVAKALADRLVKNLDIPCLSTQ